MINVTNQVLTPEIRTYRKFPTKSGICWSDSLRPTNSAKNTMLGYFEQIDQRWISCASIWFVKSLICKSQCESVWLHSFRLACASKIKRGSFELSKFHCARTKCETIATNVIRTTSEFSTHFRDGTQNRSYFFMVACSWQA